MNSKSSIIWLFYTFNLITGIMSHLQYFSYKGFGEHMREALSYNQAVRIGDRIEISGQGTLYLHVIY